MILVAEADLGFKKKGLEGIGVLGRESPV